MPELQDQDIFRTILESLQTGVYLVGRDGRILFWNDGAEKITGYLRHEALGRLCRENVLAHCNDHNCVHCGVSCPMTGTLHEGKSSECEVYFRHKKGHRVLVYLRTVAIRDSHGSVIGAAESFDEQRLVSEMDNSQTNLAAHNLLDIGSGALTRELIQSHLRENLAFFLQFQLPFGILYVRVEQMDEFRAAHGREAGEAILHVIVQNMKHTLGAAGFMGRWGENYFLIIVPNCEARDLTRAAENVKRIVNSSGIQWWALSVTVSLVQAMVQPGDSMESIMKRAERALEPKSQNEKADQPKSRGISAS
jgi:PAS domain S-box-containing protein/diguanylate cyclase (GGDEF)-like protein